MNKAYKLMLSNGVQIKADEDELDKVKEAIKTGSWGKVRQGMFNPSFLISIVEDTDRLEQLESANEKLENSKRLHPEKAFPESIKFKPLKDIFDSKRLLK